jgi:hypothetical protein
MKCSGRYGLPELNLELQQKEKYYKTTTVSYLRPRTKFLKYYNV